MLRCTVLRACAAVDMNSVEAGGGESLEWSFQVVLLEWIQSESVEMPQLHT
jgi:hypothetical protein